MFLVVVIIFITFLIPNFSLAHPGRTASDGCHYCRTNCDDWGEAWNVRHCHGGLTSTPPPTIQYESNSVVQPVSPLPTPLKSIVTPPPTSEPDMESATTSDTIVAPRVRESYQTPDEGGATEKESNETEPISGTETLLGFAILGGLGYGTYRGGKFIVKKIIK